MKIIWVNMCSTYTGLYSGKEYGFKATDDDYEVGEFVVVDAANLLQVAKVVRVDDWTPESRATKYVIEKINLEKHFERVEKEKKKSELMKKMNKRTKELTLQTYMMLAKEDPIMETLVKEYMEIVP